MAHDIDGHERAFQRDPADEKAFIALRHHYQQAGDGAALAQLYERHAHQLKDGKRAAEMYWRAAESYRQHEDADGEMRALRRALDVDAGSRRALERFKAAAEEAERWPELLDALQFELQGLVNSAADGKRVARIECQLAALWETRLYRLDRALFHYKRAFNADTGCTEAIEAGRRIYASLGQWRAVAQLFEAEIANTAATDARRKVDLLVARGELLRDKIGDLEAAAQNLAEAAALRPGEEAILEALGEIYASPEWPTPGGLDKAAAIYMQIAQRHQSHGDRDQAIAYLRRALGADPENEAASSRLERAYQETGRWEDLESLYRQRISAATEMEAVELLMRRAEVLERKLGDATAARECYETVLAQEPPGGPAALRLREIYRATAAFDELLRLLQRELESTKDRATRVHLMLEIALVKRDHLGDAEGAAVLLHEVLQLDPGHRKALEAYEDYFRQKGDYRNLAELIRFAAQTAREGGAPPSEIVPRLEELATVSEERLGDLEGALDAWRQIAELRPDAQRAQRELPRLATKMQLWHELVAPLRADLERVTAPQQRLGLLRRIAGLHREHQIDPPGLAEVLREILEHDPADEQVVNALIEVYETEGDYDGLAWAIRVKLDGIITAAERSNLLRRLGDIYAEQLERPMDALRAYQDLLQIAPQDARVIAKVQQLLEDAEDLDELVRVLEQRVDTARSMDDRLKALKELAELVDTRLDVPSRAIACWEEVRKLTPEDPAPLEPLARLYQRTNQPEQLLEVLMRRLDHAEPGSPAARAALLRQIAVLAEEHLEEPVIAMRSYEELVSLLPASHDAQRALTRLYTRAELHEQLIAILERQIDLSDDPEERVALAFKQVDVFEHKLGDPIRAIGVFERIITELAPGDVDAHRRLRVLLLDHGDYVRAAELAERELFLTPAADAQLADRRELALEIARLWTEKAQDWSRAQLAYERVLELDANNPTALAALRRLYHRSGSYEKLVKLAADIFSALPEGREREIFLIELAQVCEDKLREPLRAFEWYRRAHALYPESEVPLAQLRRMAEQHGLWEDLITVYEDGRRRVSSSRQHLLFTMQMAEVCADRLNDPPRAFDVLCEALQVDPAAEQVLGPLEELAHGAKLYRRLYEVYGRVIAHTPAPAKQAELLARQARLAEEQLADGGRALAALVRRFPLVAGDAARAAEAVADIERIAERTGAWEPALEIHQQRFRDAPGDEQKLDVLRHTAELLEHKAHDIPGAFRVYLKAFALRQLPELINNAWRLAREISRGQPPPRGPSGAPPLVIEPEKSRAESTIEISARDIIDLSSRPAIEATKPQREDSTIELSASAVIEVVAPARVAAARPAREDPTITLGAADVIEVIADGTPPARADQTQRTRPPAPPLGSPWEAIAETYRALAAPDNKTRVAHLLAIADVYNSGAGDVARALDTLQEAALIAPLDADVQRSLRALADGHGRHDRVIEIYRDLIDRAAEARTLLQLHLRAGELVLDHGRAEEAEAHFAAVLAIQPDHAECTALLSRFYERREKWQQLAQLLERRLEKLAAKLTADERLAHLEQLADLHEYHLDRPHEATEILSRIVAERPTDTVALQRLAEIYEALGVWPKQIEALEALVALAEDPVTRGGLMLRIARCFRSELELPDRAIEAFERVLRDQPGDLEALAALEQLYRAHDQPQKLAEVLRRQVALLGEQADVEDQRSLLVRLARAMEDLGDHAGAAAHLQRARAMGPPDAAIEEGLARALVAAGEVEQAVQLLRDQVKNAEEEGRDAEVIAAMLVSLARLQRSELGDADAAQYALREALAWVPEHREALLELSRLSAKEGRWEDHVEVVRRLAATREDDEEAAEQLVTAAQALVAAGQRDPARTLLEEAWRRRPRDLPIVDALLALAGEDPQRRQTLLLRKRQLVSTPEAQAAVLTELAQVKLAAGAPPAEVAGLYEEVLAAHPTYVPAIEALSAFHLEQGDSETAQRILEEATRRLEGTPEARSAGQIYYRLGELFERRDRSEEGYTYLMQALRLQPKNLLLRLAVGQNRYRAHRWREALRHFGEAMSHADAEQHSQLVAEALYCAGQCERYLRRPEHAVPYYRAALERDPGHIGALKEIATDALDRGAVAEAGALLRRVANATEAPKERVKLLATLGDLYLEQLEDERAAADCYASWVDALETLPPPTKPGEKTTIDLDRLETLLPLLQRGGHHVQAARAADRLAAAATAAADRRRLLLAAATEYAAAALGDAAESRWRELLELDPACGEALRALALIHEEREELDAAVELLEGHLWRLPPPIDAAAAELRTDLYETLARIQRGRGQIAAAIEALERRLKISEDVDVRLLLVGLYDLHQGREEAALANHRVLARDITQINSQHAVARAALASGARFRAYFIHHVLEVIGATDPEMDAAFEGFSPTVQDLEAPYQGEITDADRMSFLALPEVGVLREVFSAIWEAAPALFSRDIGEHAVSPQHRVSPVATSNLALVFSAVARALGIKRTVLYHRPEADAELSVVCMAPAAIIVNDAFAARPVAELRFLLARALELTQPSFILGAGLAREEFTHLLASVLAAFHPRQVRRKRLSDDVRDEVERLRRTLPYAVSRRLGELFRKHADAPFDSAKWRTAVARSANRIGLVFGGDVNVALRLLRAEDPALGDGPVRDLISASAAIRDLLSFAVGEGYYICRNKLGLCEPT